MLKLYEFLDKELFTDIAGESTHEVDLVVKAKFKGKDSLTDCAGGTF